MHPGPMCRTSTVSTSMSLMAVWRWEHQFTSRWRRYISPSSYSVRKARVTAADLGASSVNTWLDEGSPCTHKRAPFDKHFTQMRTGPQSQ